MRPEARLKLTAGRVALDRSPDARQPESSRLQAEESERKPRRPKSVDTRADLVEKVPSSSARWGECRGKLPSNVRDLLQFALVGGEIEARGHCYPDTH